MQELNTTTLRGILAAILSVDEKYIVPKQGNWWNPQEADANIENWCAYRIVSNTPRTAPFYVSRTENGQEINSCVVTKIATIELQFVGPSSETLAQSVANWPLRADVNEQFKTVQGSIMLDDMNAISSIFSQDGNNTITAWNVRFDVLWESITDTTQGLMIDLTLEGTIKRL